MSNTQIYAFDKNGDTYLYGETDNSWRGGMAVWTYMEDKYLPPFVTDYVKLANWYTPGMPWDKIVSRLGFKPTRLSYISSPGKEDPSKEIWNLADDPSVPLNERIVLMTTFDRILVRKEDLPRVIGAFDVFPAEHTSLKEQTEILRRIAADEKCIAVGWNQTSVNAEHWGNFNNIDSESAPYNCLKQNEHYWLFDE